MSKNNPDYKNSSMFSSNLSNKSTKTFQVMNLLVSFSNNKLYELNLIDSPGYSVKNHKQWLADIKKYLKHKHEEYYKNKEKSKNASINDCRVHLCLFFTNSSDETDLNLMRELSAMTSLVPVIGKVISVIIIGRYTNRRKNKGNEGANR
jgi:septin family protein